MTICITPTTGAPEAAVTVCGEMPAAEAHRAEGVIGRILRRHHLGEIAWVRLTGPCYPEGPAVAQVNLSVGGRAVRAQAAGPGSFALTFAAERLDRQLWRITSDSDSRWGPDPGRRPLAYPSEDRQIVRRKSFGLRTCHPVTAVAAMDAGDYDAHLFTDLETGEDALVYWAGPLGVRLVRQRHQHPPRLLRQRPLTVNPHPTRIMADEHAATLVCHYGLPFLFYTDECTGRGRLLYRRYDGDLALIAAAE